MVWGRPGGAYITRIHLAKGILEEARARVARNEVPPPAELLPVASSIRYPEAALEELAGALSDPKAYQVRAGGISLEFLTPPLIRVEVPPIVSARNCGPLMLRVSSRETGRGRRKFVRGCFGACTYPPESFRPGASLVIHLSTGKETGDAEIIPLNRDIEDRVWSDFRPYFESVRQGAASGPADDSL